MSDENNNNTDNADLLDDWEDEGLENVGVQDEAPSQPPSAEQQTAQSPEDLIDLPPVKKKKGGGFLIFLLLLLVGGGGGGYYYLTTPAGEPYRDYLPEAVRDFLPPTGDAQQQATAPQPQQDAKQAQDTAESGFDAGGYSTGISGDDSGFGAPPMPTAVYEEDRETVESGADAWSPLPFGEASEEEDQSFELAWGSSEEESFSAEEAVENGEPQVAETQEEDAVWEMGLWGEINEAQDGVEESATDFSASEEFPVEAVTADSLYEDKTVDKKSDRKDEAADAESFDVDPFSFVPLGVEEKAEMPAAADAGREETGVISEKAETRTEKEPEKKITAKEETVKQTAEKDTQEKLEVKEVQQLRAEPPRTETSRAEPVRAEVKREWRLDAASPGAALLSEKNTSERREVSVGDTIPGLGRITSIAPDDESGRWVVRGTQGSVYQ
ncbi:MAG: hypothetical protein EA357_09390 [Micavibrio sp.]|nr:MAG: hypothetical protein EA357_09390 [Micavibrio sp.]